MIFARLVGSHVSAFLFCFSIEKANKTSEICNPGESKPTQLFTKLGSGHSKALFVSLTHKDEFGISQLATLYMAPEEEALCAEVTSMSDLS